MAKLFLATLCDDVREEKSGKFSLMGLFDRFIVGDFRAPLPTFWLFVQIGCDTNLRQEAMASRLVACLLKLPKRNLGLSIETGRGVAALLGAKNPMLRNSLQKQKI
jgi:hypothetical protein